MKKKNVTEKNTAGKHISFWMESVEPLHFASLKKDVKADVVIIGAGIAGLSVAYRLCQLNKKVIVIDDGAMGGGETGHTSAHFVNALDNRYYKLEKMFGEREPSLPLRVIAKQLISLRKLLQRKKLIVTFEEFQDIYFFIPLIIEKILIGNLMQPTRADLSVEMEERIPGIQSKRKQPCIKFLNQAEFHPLKYLQGLAKSIIKRGGSIYSETKAIKIETTVVETENGQHIDADHIVVATNSPVNDNKIYLKQFAYRTYMIGALIKKNSLSHALWWDTGDFNMNPRMPPYHYVRIQSFDEKNDLLLCGGEDHPTGLSGGVKISEEKRYDRIERWLKQKFSVRKVAYRWSGQVMETMDGLAFIGKSPGEKNIYIVTGDSGNGLTHGTIAGILIPDLILEKKNEWEELYRPSRVKVLKAGKTWLQEFGGGFFSYLKESPSTETIDSIKSLHRDEVTMVKKDKKKLGVYRDGKDQLHVVNTECTHLGCTVKWNTDERSWDCPCHGSRFTYEGRVLNSPAIDNLEYYTTSFEKFLASKNKMQSRTVKKSRKVKNKTVMSP